MVVNDRPLLNAHGLVREISSLPLEFGEIEMIYSFERPASALKQGLAWLQRQLLAHKRILRAIARSAMALFASVVVFIAALAFSSPAHAVPWNCPISGQNNSRSVICFEGSGSYRIGLHCVAWHGASGRYVYGPWYSVSNPKPSAAWCGWSERLGAAWVNRID